MRRLDGSVGGNRRATRGAIDGGGFHGTRRWKISAGKQRQCDGTQTQQGFHRRKTKAWSRAPSDPYGRDARVEGQSEGWDRMNRMDKMKNERGRFLHFARSVHSVPALVPRAQARWPTFRSQIRT